MPNLHSIYNDPTGQTPRPRDFDTQAMHARLARIETRLVKLMLHFGLQVDGNITQKDPCYKEVNMSNKTFHSPTHGSPR